jgi:hypothetical protein
MRSFSDGQIVFNLFFVADNVGFIEPGSTACPDFAQFRVHPTCQWMAFQDDKRFQMMIEDPSLRKPSFR